MNEDIGYRYTNSESVLSGFQQHPNAETLHNPVIYPSGRDLHYNIDELLQNGITMGKAAMNDPDYYKYNALAPEGPLAHFKGRSAQINTDLHLPPHLFKPNRRETYHEELYGAPSARFNPEIYGNGNISGRIRNYTSLADKNRLMKGAMNYYLPTDAVCGESGANFFGSSGYGNLPFSGSVFDGWSTGMQKTERRRVNYGLTQVPHSEEMLRNLVPLTSPQENVFSNRWGGSSTSYLSLGSLYNPKLNEPYTHAGVGQSHYWKNAGVSENNHWFEKYRPRWIGKQEIRPEMGKSDSIMRFQNRELIDSGIRSNTSNNNLYQDNPNTYNMYN